MNLARKRVSNSKKKIFRARIVGKNKTGGSDIYHCMQNTNLKSFF